MEVIPVDTEEDIATSSDATIVSDSEASAKKVPKFFLQREVKF